MTSSATGYEGVGCLQVPSVHIEHLFIYPHRPEKQEELKDFFTTIWTAALFRRFGFASGVANRTK